MSYEKKWKILADLLIEIQKGGEKIPKNVINDLRSAKTVIQILKFNQTDTKSILKIDKYLRNVEAYAIFCAEKLGIENVEEWLKKLKDPKKEENKEKPKIENRFVSGTSRNKTWISIETSEDLTPDLVKKVAKDNNLSYEIHKNGHIIVCGHEKEIKSFLKRIGERFRFSRNA